MIRIIVDCFGGDNSPSANVEGAVKALSQNSDLSLVLTGDENLIRSELQKFGASESDRLSIVHAPEVIGCDEKPTDAIRLKRESSMMKAISLLREDESLSGMVSIGSTGALVSASMLRLGRVEGVFRPAFCPVIPSLQGGIVGICDSGANMDCKPEYLCQFAVMGSQYLKNIYNVSSPKVKLLNVGVEAEKGDNLRKDTYKLLEEADNINFTGNMESRELLSGQADLIVCDGFAGNVLLKTAEGTVAELLNRLKKDIYSKNLYKIGALLMSKLFKDEKKLLDYRNYGGSVMLGLTKTVVKGHGNSKATSVAVCIEQAYKMEQTKLNENIREAISHVINTKTQQQ